MNIKRWNGNKKKYKLKKGRKQHTQPRLNYITLKLNLLEGENDMIKLNPTNSKHIDWWEDN
ncbi:hypothetical protein ACXAT3_002702 [Clostridium sporogenes]